MRKYKVGIIGATGMVGQRFLQCLENHPWFEVVVLAASPRSSGKTLQEVLKGRESIKVPSKYLEMIIKDASKDAPSITNEVDFVFCAVEMPKEETKNLEELYAKLECPVISNNSAHRLTDDVPMIIPEINASHLDIIHVQRQRLNTKRGFIAVKANCSIQSYLPLLYPLNDFEIAEVIVTTLQAISGAGKTFESWPEMKDNVIPFINGEEHKSEQEPLKICGNIADNKIVNADLKIQATCIRVPVSDGHMASVTVKFKQPLAVETVTNRWHTYHGEPQILNLPSAPKQFIHFFNEDDMPQTKLCRDLERGMAISAGRLKAISDREIRFIGLSHNTLRGAAGGALLLAELLCAKNYIERK